MWLIEAILMLLVFFIGAAFGVITEDRTLKKWFDERLNEFYSQKDKEIEMLKSMLEKDKDTLKLIEGNVGNDDERVNNLYKEAEEISNTAIKHCLDVAEQNEISAITYKNCKEIKANMYEKLTAEKAENDCRECAADHRQLAEWLKELKNLREENKVLISECDRLIKEKGELLSKVSGGDVLRICQLEEQLEKAKELLKLAVEDMSEKKFCAKVCKRDNFACRVSDTCDFKWRYADEAEKLLNNEK